jgi:ribosomal protein L3 glutamine methyltransferase
MARKAVKRTSAKAPTSAKTKRMKSVRSRMPNPAALVLSIADHLVRDGVIFAHGTTDPIVEAAFMVSEVLGIHPDRLEARSFRPVTKAQKEKLGDLVAQRIVSRKPAAYLLNKIYMRGVPFYIDERAIIPRSYLGELLDEYFAGPAAWVDPQRVTRVLDLCTGSGCLAILAARMFPNARVDAVDLSSDALEVARRNVADHKVGHRITLYQGDLFAPLPRANYDLIIANPPYVDAEGMANLPPECRYEPAMAFYGGADGIAIVRRIIDAAPNWLKPGGGLLCEVGRCKSALERAYPWTPFLWLDTEESEDEVFWLQAAKAT